MTDTERFVEWSRTATSKFGEKRQPANRQAAIVASSSPKRVGVAVEKPELHLIPEDKLVPIPRDGYVSLRIASRCRFTPKSVIFRKKRKWIDPMDWPSAFDATLDLLDEWFGPTMQYIDEKYLGSEMPSGVEEQWTYCYFLRHICKFLDLTNDDIVFQAFVPRSIR